MLHDAAIDNAYFINSCELAKGCGSAQVSALLADIAGPSLCVAEICRSDGRFTLILDAEWAALGLQVSKLPVDLTNPPVDVELPRGALLAVIAGWPHQWDQLSKPQMRVHFTDDLIPHITVSEESALTDRSVKHRAVG